MEEPSDVEVPSATDNKAWFNLHTDRKYIDDKKAHIN